MIILKHILIIFLTGRVTVCQEQRIVGGQNTPIKMAPYTVSVHYNTKEPIICGGSILNRYTIATAAHCLRHNTINIRAGSTFLHSDGMYIQIERMLPHPFHNNETKVYDVGVIWLKEPLNFSDAIQPIDIVPEGQVTPPGTIAFVTGWGLLKEGGQNLSEVLQGVEVQVISREKCNEFYTDRRPITETMICAGYEEGGKDSCTFDSGGPLVVNGKQIGLVNWGVGCARPRRPGVYANLAAPDVRKWVYDNLKPDPTP